METQSSANSQDEVAIEQEILRGRQEEANDKNQVSKTISLSIWQKLILLVKRRVFIGYEIQQDWRRSLPIYAFRCPRHGIQTDYKHGFYERLDCPLCRFSLGEYPPEMNV